MNLWRDFAPLFCISVGLSVAASAAALPKYTYFWSVAKGSGGISEFNFWEFEPATKKFKSIIDTGKTGAQLEQLAAVESGGGASPFVVAVTEDERLLVIRDPKIAQHMVTEVKQLPKARAVCEAGVGRALVVGPTNTLYYVNEEGEETNAGQLPESLEGIRAIRMIAHDAMVAYTRNSFAVVDLNGNGLYQPTVRKQIVWDQNVIRAVLSRFVANADVIWAEAYIDDGSGNLHGEAVAWGISDGQIRRHYSRPGANLKLLSVEPESGDLIFSDTGDYAKLSLATGTRETLDQGFFFKAELERMGLPRPVVDRFNVEHPRQSSVPGKPKGIWIPQSPDDWVTFINSELALKSNSTAGEFADAVSKTNRLKYEFKHLNDQEREILRKQFHLFMQMDWLRAVKGEEGEKIERYQIAKFLSDAQKRQANECQKKLASG